MKKTLSFILLFALLLSACGANAGNEPTVPDPAADDTLNVLLVGNSFSCGFGEELATMLETAGIKANIYSVYYGSSTTKMHLNWLQKGTEPYRLRLYQPGGTHVDELEVGMDFCLAQQNWDVISLQQHFMPSVAKSYETALAQCEPSVSELLNYFKTKHPKAKLAWFETWTYELGWEGGDILIDQAFQEQSQDNICAVSEKLARDNGVALVNCGDAWAIARKIPNIGQLDRGDLCHDGEAGGQYLNACVWYEFLTGNSCLESTWIPGDSLGYTIEETKAEHLRQAAHKAFAENPIK